MAAVVGAAGSIVGGLVGGLFALWAVHWQFVRDRKQKRADESHQAAKEVAAATGPLQVAFQKRVAGQDIDLYEACNAFVIQAGTLAITITDPDLRRRIRNHVLLSHEYAMIPDIATLGIKLTWLNDHGDKLRDAIYAHCNEHRLPIYEWPPDIPLPPGTITKDL
jgi:hypothetical protein